MQNDQTKRLELYDYKHDGFLAPDAKILNELLELSKRLDDIENELNFNVKS